MIIGIGFEAREEKCRGGTRSYLLLATTLGGRVGDADVRRAEAGTIPVMLSELKGGIEAEWMVGRMGVERRQRC